MSHPDPPAALLTSRTDPPVGPALPSSEKKHKRKSPAPRQLNPDKDHPLPMVGARIPQELKNDIESKTKSLGTDSSKLIRGLLSAWNEGRAFIRPQDHPIPPQRDVRPLLYELNRIGTNLNQIAHGVNFDNVLGRRQDVARLRAGIVVVQQQLDGLGEILERLRIDN